MNDSTYYQLNTHDTILSATFLYHFQTKTPTDNNKR